MSDTIKYISDASFDADVMHSTTPVLVDYWAEWCGPCKAIAPILEEISTEQSGKLQVTKVNVDENPGLARTFDVMSIPTLLVFQDGEVKRKLVGAMGKSQLLDALDEFV